MNSNGFDLILKQLKADDKNAINKLYENYSRRLYNFAFAYLKNNNDALDIVQEVFINIWDKRSCLRADTNFEAYLFTITKNSVISLFRKKVNEKEYLEYLKQVAVIHSDETEDSFDYEILSVRIKELINQLPPQRQIIFRMSKEEGKSNKTIAEELQISVKTVEDHITKARHFLKARLAEYGITALLFYALFLS
jgi:RNA polymerase sigma-70 factor (family 1)